MALKWNGPEVLAKMRGAEKAAIDATMAACVIHGKANHGPGSRQALGRFESQTGELARSIRITDPAKEDSKGVVGRWGSRGLAYARRIELGFQGKDSKGRVVNSPKLPFLRPAAEAEYPKLAGRVKRAFK